MASICHASARFRSANAKTQSATSRCLACPTSSAGFSSSAYSKSFMRAATGDAPPFALQPWMFLMPLSTPATIARAALGKTGHGVNRHAIGAARNCPVRGQRGYCRSRAGDNRRHDVRALGEHAFFHLQVVLCRSNPSCRTPRRNGQTSGLPRRTTSGLASAIRAASGLAASRTGGWMCADGGFSSDFEFSAAHQNCRGFARDARPQYRTRSTARPSNDAQEGFSERLYTGAAALLCSTTWQEACLRRTRTNT